MNLSLTSKVLQDMALEAEKGEVTAEEWATKFSDVAVPANED